MQLDFIPNINEYKDAVVRLYDFDNLQATEFRKFICQEIIANKKLLPLTTLPFIEARNCHLTLRIADEDVGIIATGSKNFFCDLTIESYEKMIVLLNPFCKKITKGYQYLYDVDTPIDFLFSPAGTW